ncbi:hypothetical protein BJ878DRAFT_496146 [Calycina marina]|uniref:RRM domain-containing protein n=1 Tax=Calycina marina TaxID=1763456 RepID=A0A9P7Z7H9_9HELO|nr:hypothetical protein BJ878DRAFT_496146 [Calycina marina]
MALNMALDEIVASRERPSGPRGRRGGGNGEARRNDYPRDGVRKSYREDRQDNIDSEWVHDKFENGAARRPARDNRRYNEPAYDSASPRLRVENLHYDLTEEDLDDLFNQIGPVLKTALTYDRAGRSEGVAYVTYETARDAQRAIKEYDGANAKGQPIHLISIPAGPSNRRNPFHNVVPVSRPLADRISRARSLSPHPAGVDRYVPDHHSRSRSPMPPRRREGRQPGNRQERGGRGDRRGRGGRGEGRGGRGGREGVGKDGRPRKTQEELDAEMEDYWGAKKNGVETATPAATAAPADDDIAMIG